MILSKLTQIPTTHRIIIGCLLIVLIILLNISDSPKPDIDFYKYSVGEPYPLNIKSDSLDPNDSQSQQRHLLWKTYTIESGESASTLFERVGLSATQLQNIIRNDDTIKEQLTRLRPGDQLTFGFDYQNKIIQLIHPINEFETFTVKKTDNGYKGKIEKKKVETQLNYTKANITSNFWNASVSAGLSAGQIIELANIFGWDIDFALDIRAGDSFQVLYEEKYVDGTYTGDSRIIAASFTNRGDTFTAVRNEKDGDFYEPSGHAMKKAFLRAPIDFRYVSSNFNPRRLHPVTGLVKPHRGTDYVAPVGTPIWAAGNGTVFKAGYNQFNGNYVFIRHSNTYITKYLHMTKRYVNTGERVKQGDIVGTLGGTGRVTGPHLHYEFLVNGVHQNPRTVDLPQSKSLTGENKRQFKILANQRLKQLTKYDKLMMGTQPVINHYK